MNLFFAGVFSGPQNDATFEIGFLGEIPKRGHVYREVTLSKAHHFQYPAVSFQGCKWIKNSGSELRLVV